MQLEIGRLLRMWDFYSIVPIQDCYLCILWNYARLCYKHFPLQEMYVQVNVLEEPYTQGESLILSRVKVTGTHIAMYQWARVT